MENAIKHGIMPRNEGGTIMIAASRDNGRLVIRVSDDGLGLKGDPRTLLDKGVGLKNIRSRIQSLYGSDGVLSFQNRTDGGVQVAFDIPFQNKVP